MTAIPFQGFLLRHQFTPERAFVNEYPLGCLLDAASPTRSLQSGSFVHPLTKLDWSLQVDGPRIAIVGGATDDLSDVARGRVTVGADPQRADVVLPGEAIAPVHAYFFVRRGRIHVADCGAPHGTFLAGERLRPLQRVPLRPGAITEVWFGDEGYFHFDAKALYAYVHYLLGTHERPSIPSDTTAARAAEAAPGPERPAEEARPDDPAPADRWAGGVALLRRLGASLADVRVLLDRAAAPITLYDADARHDLEQALTALEGMRPLVTQVQAHLRRSRLDLTVYRRA